MKGTVKLDYTNASGAKTSKQVTFSDSFKIDDIVFPSLRALIGVWESTSNDNRKYGVNDILSKLGGVKGIFGGVLLGDTGLSNPMPDTLVGFAGEGSSSEANQGSLVSQTLNGNVLTEVFSFRSLQGTMFGNTQRTDRLVVRLAHKLCTHCLSKTGQGSPFINYLQGNTAAVDTPRANTAKFESEYGENVPIVPLVSVDRYYKNGQATSNYGGNGYYKMLQVSYPGEIEKESLSLYVNSYKESWKKSQKGLTFGYDDELNDFTFGYFLDKPSISLGGGIITKELSYYSIEPSADDTVAIIGEYDNGTPIYFFSTSTGATEDRIGDNKLYNSLKPLLQGNYMFLSTPSQVFLLVITSSKIILYMVSPDSEPKVYREYQSRVYNGTLTGGLYLSTGTGGFLVSTTTSILYIPLGQVQGLVDMNYRDTSNKGCFFYKVQDAQVNNDIVNSLSLLKSWYPAGKFTYNTLANPLGNRTFYFSGLNANWSKEFTITVTIDFN